MTHSVKNHRSRRPPGSRAASIVASLLMLASAAGCATPQPGTPQPRTPGSSPAAAGLPGPGTPAGGSQLAQAEAALQGGNAAANAIDRRLRLADGADAEARLAMGEVNLRSGRLAQALHDFEAVEGVRELRAQALLGQGLVLTRMGRREASQEKLLAAVDADPSLWRAWNAIGWNYDLDGAYRQAEESYAKALAKALEAGADPAEVYNNQGVSCLMQGLYAEAETAFRRALEANPNLEAARANLQLALSGQD